MAEMSVTLKHGYIAGKGTDDEIRYKEVTFRELTSKDVIDARWRLSVWLLGRTAKRLRTALRCLWGWVC